MIVNDDVLSLLKRIGLNQYESRIYTALLSKGTSTAGELAEISDVPRSRVYDVLTGLEKKGFAIIQVGRPVKYVAVPPQEALKKVRRHYEDEHERWLKNFDRLQESLIESLEPIYSEGKISADVSDLVGLIRGHVNLYSHIEQLIDNSKDRIVKLTTDKGLKKLEKTCKPTLENAVKRGVKARVIVHAPDEKGEHVRSIKEIADVRKTDTVNGRFLVKDGEEAILIASPDTSHQHLGLWIRSPYLAGWLEKLFEHVWERGEPVGE